MNWLKDIFLVASFRHDKSMSSSACPHVLPCCQCRQRCRWPEPTRRRSPKGPLKWSADLSTALRRRIWFTPKSSKIKHGNGQIPCFFLINVPWKPPNYGIWCMPTIHCQSAPRLGKSPVDFPATELLPICLVVDLPLWKMMVREWVRQLGYLKFPTFHGKS